MYLNFRMQYFSEFQSKNCVVNFVLTVFMLTDNIVRKPCCILTRVQDTLQLYCQVALQGPHFIRTQSVFRLLLVCHPSSTLIPLMSYKLCALFELQYATVELLLLVGNKELNSIR